MTETNAIYQAPFVYPKKAADPRIIFSDECLMTERHDSRAGRTVKFLLPPESEHHPFADYDKETRFYAVFVRIDENESAAAETEMARTERKFERAKARGGRHSKFAAIMGRDRSFQIYLVRLGWIKTHWRKQTREQMSAQFICDQVGIASRAELDSKDGAFDLFRDKVERPFFKWLQGQKRD